jgi:hypothetical protein
VASSQVWEIYTGGRNPYGTLRNRELLMALLQDEPLEHAQPAGCPDDLYTLLCRCWAQDPHARPTFSAIAEAICVLAGGVDDKGLAKDGAMGAVATWSSYLLNIDSSSMV